jgi:hypothetical protein
MKHCYTPLFSALVMAVSVCPASGQTPAMQEAELTPGFLTRGELNPSGGTFYYQTGLGMSANECLFGSINDSSDMGLRLKARLLRLKLVSSSFTKRQNPNLLMPGDQLLDTYSSGGLQVRIQRTIEQVGKESMSFHGTLTITKGRFFKVVQVSGVGLG